MPTVPVIEQYDGAVRIQVRDDALNANGYAIGDMRDWASEAQAGEQIVVTAWETCVLIAGGTLTVANTTGLDSDGIDSNGNITITGGTIRITISGDMVTNPGSVYSEPLITVYVSGNITLMVGRTIVELANVSSSIVLDCALKEA